MSVTGPGSVGDPTSTPTMAPGWTRPASTTAFTANHTTSSVVPWRSVTRAVMPHAIDSARAVSGDGVAAITGTRGRKREIARAVAPLFVQAMIAFAPYYAAARQHAAEMAAVMREAGSYSCDSATCCRPRRAPQPS